MNGRKRHVIPMVLGAFVATAGLAAGGPPAEADDPPHPFIDEFEVSIPRVVFRCPQGTSTPPVSATGSSIGGEIDLAIVPGPTSDCAGALGVVETSGPGSSLSIDSFDEIGDADPVVTATWDGPDNSPALDPVGLDNADLTAGGTKDSFAMRFPGTNATMTLGQLRVTVYTDAGHYSTLGPTPIVTQSEQLVVPFANSTPGAGSLGAADFTDVGAIVVEISDVNTDIRSYSMDWLRAIPATTVRMTDTLAIDADANGHPTIGDTIEYTVTLARPAYVPVEDAVFALTPSPAATTLVPGSVTTTAGSVATGNGPADTSISVAVGDLPAVPGSVATETITFRAVIAAGGALTNQGDLTYNIGSAPGATTTTTDSDDPDTSAYSDATVTAVVDAKDDTVTAEFETPVTGNVLTNDTGPSSVLVADQVAAPGAGTVEFNADGSFTYTPGEGFSGTDTFTYRATSLEGASDDATVTINVGPGPSAVAAVADSYDTTFETPVAGNVLANDTGGSGQLAAELVDAPAHGTLDLGGDGTFTYTPAAGFSGTDTFTYRATSPGQGDPLLLALPADVGLVTITVAAPPTTEPPTTDPGTPGSTLPAPPTTAPLAPTIPATLPATGSDSFGLTLTALLVLGLGAAATIAARKPQRRPR